MRVGIGIGLSFLSKLFLPLAVSIASTSPSSLTEGNLNTATVTVDLLNGWTYDGSLVNADFTLLNVPSGVTLSSVSRTSNTRAVLTLAYDNTDFDVDANFQVRVNASAVVGAISSVTSGNVAVTALVEGASIQSTSPSTLTEGVLDSATITVDITGATYDATLNTTDFTLLTAPSGVTIGSVSRTSATRAVLTLAYNGTDMTADTTMSVRVETGALATGNGAPYTTGSVNVFQFAPSDFGANLVGWWDSDFLGLANNAAVSTVTDRSGNVRDLGLGDAATYKTNIQNGKAVVRLTVGNDYLRVTSSAFRPADWSWAVVYAHHSTNNGTSPFSYHLSTGNAGWTLYKSTTPRERIEIGTPGVSGMSSAATASVNDAFQAVGMDHNETTDANNMYFNSATSTASVTQSNSWGAETPALTIGRKYSDTTDAVGGTLDFCEAFFVNRLWTTTERQNVMRYLGNKWGITIT